jgi:multiple sugar transport system permease protein
VVTKPVDSQTRSASSIGEPLPVAAATRAFSRTRRRSRRQTRQAAYFYLFVTPWMAGFVGLALIPIGLGLAMSFTNYDGYNLDTVRWVGLDNYDRALHDEDAHLALERTLVLLVVAVPGAIALQLGLALLLNGAVRARGLFRTLFYLPSVIPIVAAAWIWKGVGAPDGFLNTAVGTVADTQVGWLVDRSTQLLSMWLLWAWSGAGMLIFLAALQGIPSELREAAAIDGASRLQILRKVDLPLLTPVIFFQLVMTVFLAFQLFIEPILLAPGLTSLANPPPPENTLFAVDAFQQVFVNQRFGYGAALLWILFAISLLTTIVLFATAKYWVFYDRPDRSRRR